MLRKMPIAFRRLILSVAEPLDGKDHPYFGGVS